MQAKTRGIVLHAIPYNDKYTIVHLYTEMFGRSAYLVARSRGRKSIVSKALFMPFSVIELEVEHKNRRDLQRIKETRSCFPINELHCNPIKNVLTLFLSEVVYRTVKETEPDSRLFGFLYQSISFLESTGESVANYHLVFLLHLLFYLGIHPNSDSYKAGYCFDLLNGEFVNHASSHRHFLTQEESLVFRKLLKMSFENMCLYAFSRQDRIAIIERIIEYYRLHLPEFSEIKSLAILKSMFD